MSKQFFNTVMRGMEEARAYMEGARDGYRVTESPSTNAKSWVKLREAMSSESQARMDDRLKEALCTVPLDTTPKGFVTCKGEQAQMKKAWDSYLDQQLTDPTVRQAFEEETKVLGIGLQLADQRKRQGLSEKLIRRRSCGQSGKSF